MNIANPITFNKYGIKLSNKTVKEYKELLKKQEEIIKEYKEMIKHNNQNISKGVKVEESKEDNKMINNWIKNKRSIIECILEAIEEVA